MARVFIILFVLFVFGSLIPENEALNNQGSEIPVPTNGRIQAMKGSKCLNFLWDRPCTKQPCRITLKYKMQSRTSPQYSATTTSSYVPATTKNNASFVQCIYDSSAGQNNFSCCNSIKSGANLTSGFPEPFSAHGFWNISFEIKVCLTGSNSGNCVIKKNGFDFILPWRNPCFFENPCQNSGVCNAGIDTYTCSCTEDWKGSNCTLPKKDIDNNGSPTVSVALHPLIMLLAAGIFLAEY